MLVVILIAIGFLGYLEGDSIKKNFYSVKAAISDNVAGFAWSENTGWISFNNTAGGGGISYGVNVDPPSGAITGYAWSENLGWISLNRADTGDPPSNPYKNNGPLAKWNSGNGRVDGWMRVLAVCDTVPCASSGPGSNSGGWDGWIRFCDNTMANCSADNQMAKLDVSGNFQGWAWSDDKVGWVSLNCANQGNCGVSNYSVTATGINQAPTASNLSATQPNYCVAGPAATFSWIFSDPNPGDTQSAYQIQVATNSGFSGPGTVVDSGKVVSASNSYAVTQGILSYGQKYYWRVRVWDNHDAVSDWAVGSSFATPKHQYPTVNFSWAPQYPSVGEVTQFSDQSAVFGGATKQSWLWSIADAVYAAGTNSSSQNPQVKFGSIGNKSVSLTLTDSSGYSCSISKTTTVRLPLPGWKEVAPQ